MGAGSRDEDGAGGAGGRPVRKVRHVSRPALFVAFAFAVMGDPVSSVAYAIEACLRELRGDLALLVPTMAVVVGIIVLVVANYHQLIGRFARGGGAAGASGAAFGEGWAFLPLGALIVDYALTISISVAAGASAIIAFLPRLEPARVPIALALCVAVAGVTWFGHGGRAVFAVMTMAFAGVAGAVIASGLLHARVVGGTPALATGAGHWPPLAILLAFPVGMALATGVEAPSSAIAQLGQLDDAGRRRFGRATLWVMLAIVGTLTMGLADLAVRLRVGLPPANSTLVAQIAKASVGSGGLFAAFQLTSALLLLAAASSSFQAGPGLLKALAGERRSDLRIAGILPAWIGRTNRHHTPYWGVAVFLGVSVAVVAVAGGRDQVLVLYYAVAVFVSFLVGLVAMASFSRREGRRGWVVANVAGALAVTVTLLVNVGKGFPLVSLAATLAIAFGLHRAWVRAGRPRGIAEADRLAEEELGVDPDPSAPGQAAP